MFCCLLFVVVALILPLWTETGFCKEDVVTFNIREDGVKTIGIEEGLTSEIVLRIKQNRAKDAFWIVTGNSLVMMMPDHKLKTIRKIPYDNNYDLEENSRRSGEQIAVHPHRQTEIRL